MSFQGLLAHHTSCSKYPFVFIFNCVFCSEIFRVRDGAAGDADVPQDPAGDPEAHHEQVRESSRTDRLLLRHTGATHWVDQGQYFEKRDSMDQISIKTPKPKCRLYWCLIVYLV